MGASESVEPGRRSTAFEGGVRAADRTDLAAITELYNHYIRTSPATFDLDPFRASDRSEWYDDHIRGPGHVLLVAEQGGSVVGFAGSGTFRSKAAYSTTIETSVYCAAGWEGRRIGDALYTELFRRIAGSGAHRAVAGITLPNPASVALHRRHGFERSGEFHEVGRKFGRFWDVAWYEKRLDATATTE